MRLDAWWQKLWLGLAIGALWFCFFQLFAPVADAQSQATSTVSQNGTTVTGKATVNWQNFSGSLWYGTITLVVRGDGSGRCGAMFAGQGYGSIGTGDGAVTYPLPGHSPGEVDGLSCSVGYGKRRVGVPC